MLDAFIIEELKRREREGQRDDRPQPEPPEPRERERGPARQSDDDKPQRGVVIIDYSL